MTENIANTHQSEEKPCHLLPSFQMHNYLFNRNIIDDIYFCSNNPPAYEFDYMNVNETTSDFADTINPVPTSSLSIFKNLLELPKSSAAFNVNIDFVKKQLVNNKCNHFHEEYKPGDIISGCVTIQNEELNAISFDMIYISLEGEVNLPNSSMSSKNRYLSHKFLKMYDLNVLKEQLIVGTLGEDPKNPATSVSDHSQQIMPNSTHKLYFKFELPHYALDSLCKDQCNQHLKLPPSLGINSKFFGKSFDKTNDIAKIQFKKNKNEADHLSCPYQSVTYSINVLITSKQITGEIAILKNVLRYFNFDTSAEHCEKSQDPVTDTSTKEQISLIKKVTIEHLKQSSENLILDNEVEKQKQLLRTLNFTNRTVGKNSDQQFILSKNVINFKSTIWNSIAGVMAIEVVKNKFGSIKAIRSEVFTNLLNMDLPPAYNEIKTVCLALTFDPVNRIENCKLPPLIEINFTLRAMNLYSETPIPFVIDENFLLNNGLSKKNIQKMKSQFKIYLTEFKKRISMENHQDDKALLRVVNSMSKLCFWEYFIDDYFNMQKFDLKNKWAFDPSTGLYKCDLEVPLHLNVAKLSSSNYYLVPSFQSCYMSRFYGIDLDIKVNKGLQEVKIKYPVKIL